MRKNSLVAMIRKRVEAESRSHQDAGRVRASSWSPMETAPRDPTDVLLFVPGHGIHVGHRTSGPNPFWRWSHAHSGRYQRLTPPTHWMTLPAPPTMPPTTPTLGERRPFKCSCGGKDDHIASCPHW